METAVGSASAAGDTRRAERAPVGPAGRLGQSLPSGNIIRMAFHTKTTLQIDDSVMAALRREAARRGATMSALVEEALRNLLRKRRKATCLPPLPVFHGGGALVDVADREALYQAMEGR